MNHLINNEVKSIEISGIRKFFNMVSEQEDVVSLTIGQPDFTTPLHIKEAAQVAITENQTTYTHNAGMLPLRQAISNYVKTKYDLNYNPDNEIITTVGASQAIDITFRTILRPGDEVILPGPIYPGYEPLIKLAQATPVFADTQKSEFKLTVEVLKRYITNKTKCIVLPYPSNPTGATLSQKEIQTLVSFLKNRDIFILSDEIYSELTFGSSHISIGSFEEVRNKTIVIQGLSKSHAMTGWRIGFLLAPSWLSQHMLKVHQYNVSCTSSISQHAALAALTNGMNDAVPMRDAYQERMEYVYKRLEKMNLEIIKPGGAFYLFPKFPINKMSSFELALHLVEKAKLALVPGDAFSSLGQGYLRISYAYDKATLEKGMDRLENFLNKETLI